MRVFQPLKLEGNKNCLHNLKFSHISPCSASIRRVCEDVGLKLPSNQPADKSIKQFIGPSTDMTWAMANVYLTITSQTLTVETIDNGVVCDTSNFCVLFWVDAFVG